MQSKPDNFFTPFTEKNHVPIKVLIDLMFCAIWIFYLYHLIRFTTTEIVEHN